MQRLRMTLVVLVTLGLLASMPALGAVQSGSVAQAAGLTGTLTPTGSMTTQRFWHSAILLQNGKVLVVGGRDTYITATGTAELYDPASGTWSATGSMLPSAPGGPAVHWAHRLYSLTLLPNGKVLLAGGVSAADDFTRIPGAQLYDPDTGTWSWTGSMLEPRGYHTATLLPNGKVLVVGGSYNWQRPNVGPELVRLASAEIYDPGTGTWSSAAPMPTGREKHAAALLPNGKVLIFGGREDGAPLIYNDPNLPLTNTAELYDPATNSWSATGSFSHIVPELAAIPLPNGKVLTYLNDFVPATGHVEQAGHVELYDPARGTWTAGAASHSILRANVPVMLQDGRVLFFDGGTGQTAEVYDPNTDSWSVIEGVMSIPRYSTFFTATLLNSGAILIAGGWPPFGDQTQATASAELFTPGDVNRAPAASAGGPYAVGEGGTLALDGSASVDPDGDVLTYAWDTAYDGTTFTARASGVRPSVVYPDNGTVTVALRVTDSKGATSTIATAQVAVANVAPTATFAATPTALDEGGSVTLALTGATDPSSADAATGFAYAFDCGSGYGAFAAAASASCPTADNGTRTVKGQVRDKDGGVREYTAGVTVANVAPTLGAIVGPVDPVQVGTAVTITAPYSDPGTQDTHSATIDWGNGTTSAGTAQGGTAAGSHTYATPGVYTVALTVADDDGGRATTEYRYVVVYDPDGGFVTGGGWITSPAGAYAADPALTGKATFGFVSKYQKGATVPTGQTEFQFRVANLSFRSAAYEWLVISGPKAQYKGAGTINGAGDYGFLLTATDAQVSGGGGADTFRIKIWDRATGTVVYDNQLGATDNADPTTTLGGGAIQLQK